MERPLNDAPYIPEPIQGLAGIATNLSWSWSRSARELFRAIDPALWHASRHNPLELLHRVEPLRLVACAEDSDFVERYRAVLRELEVTAPADGSWFAGQHPPEGAGPVAYFCAEFGLHNSVPIYSGGLGVLAGDHCKAASDLGLPLVGVGLLYTKGYFDQRIRPDGWQEDSEQAFDQGLTPLVPVLNGRGEPSLATVRIFGRDVHVGAWRMSVGGVPVYLLDTDLEQNDPADCQLSHKLYAGGAELRLRQEWVLGIGGVRVLRTLGVRPSAWHANEGHAAFMFIERVRELTAEGTGFEEAVNTVRESSVFTTHTPVLAGHDVFGPELLERCAGPLWSEIGVSRSGFLALGRHPEHEDGAFHMTAMALRLTAKANGVSRQHGLETRKMWHCLWPDLPVDDVPVGYVTNGVHFASWMAHDIKALLDRDLGSRWENRVERPEFARAVQSLDDRDLWEVHEQLKIHLLDFINNEARLRLREQWTDAGQLMAAGTLLNSDTLTIGFARRFATYKRADLIFRDPQRLRRLLIDPSRPVQFVFAGKAHPADEPGKQVLQRVYGFAHDAKFEGRIAFLEDYDMHIAHRLTEGVDLWMNVPEVPLEACGTSGMKAALNGIPQVGTPSGWWAEGYTGSNGWVIPTSEHRDDADADHLYTLLEEEIIPLFYDRDDGNLPQGWIQHMKDAIQEAGNRFTARRMVQEYVTDYYLPAMRTAAPSDATAP